MIYVIISIGKGLIKDKKNSPAIRPESQPYISKTIMPKKIEIENRKMTPVPPSHRKTADFSDLPLFSSAIATPTPERGLTAERVCKQVGISHSELRKCRVGSFLELGNWVILHKGRNSWRVIDA